MPDNSTSDNPFRDDRPADDHEPAGLPTNVIAARARDGDPFSWDTLEPKVRQMLDETFARKWRLRRHTLEDLIAETMGDIYRDFARFRVEDGSSFRAWAMQIAKNNHIDMCRKEDREDGHMPGLVHLDQPGPGSSGNLRDRLPDPDAHRPSVDARMTELSAAFRAAVARLRDDWRRVIELRVFEGLSFEEITVRVGKNKSSTVRAIHRRARQALCEELEGFE